MNRQHELTNLFTTALFNVYLKGDEAAASVLSAEFVAGIADVRLEAKADWRPAQGARL
jgi:hypothetical protein